MTGSTIHYSAQTGGFYHSDVHGKAIPADAVRISRARHAELVAAQADGARIVADSRGRPVLERENRSLAAKRAAAIATVKREARRRILAIANLEQQSNDNAAIAMLAAGIGGSSIEDVAHEAVDRRRRIDVVRSSCAAAVAMIAALDSSQLDAFEPRWPEDDK